MEMRIPTKISGIAAGSTSVQVRDAQTIELRFDVAPGYHLYRERITVGEPVAAAPGAAKLAEPVLPHG